jgi:hypothetical protein
MDIPVTYGLTLYPSEPVGKIICIIMNYKKELFILSANKKTASLKMASVSQPD